MVYYLNCIIFGRSQDPASEGRYVAIEQSSYQLSAPWQEVAYHFSRLAALRRLYSKQLSHRFASHTGGARKGESAVRSACSAFTRPDRRALSSMRQRVLHRARRRGLLRHSLEPRRQTGRAYGRAGERQLVLRPDPDQLRSRLGVPCRDRGRLPRVRLFPRPWARL